MRLEDRIRDLCLDLEYQTPILSQSPQAKISTKQGSREVIGQNKVSNQGSIRAPRAQENREI